MSMTYNKTVHTGFNVDGNGVVEYDSDKTMPCCGTPGCTRPAMAHTRYSRHPKMHDNKPVCRVCHQAHMDKGRTMIAYLRRKGLLLEPAAKQSLFDIDDPNDLTSFFDE